MKILEVQQEQIICRQPIGGARQIHRTGTYRHGGDNNQLNVPEDL